MYENGDGTVNRCEMYSCALRMENEWRVENCPAYPALTCKNPSYECCYCEGSWTCGVISKFTNEIWEYNNADADM